MLSLIIALALAQGAQGPSLPAGVPVRTSASGSSFLVMYEDGGTSSTGTLTCRPGEFLFGDGTKVYCTNSRVGTNTFTCQAMVGASTGLPVCLGGGSGGLSGTCGADVYNAMTRSTYNACSTSAVNGNNKSITYGGTVAYAGMNPNMFLRWITPSNIAHVRMWIGWGSSTGATWGTYESSATQSYCGFRYSPTTPSGSGDAALQLCSSNDAASASCTPFAAAPAASAPWTYNIWLTATSCTGAISQDELTWEVVSKSDNIPPTPSNTTADVSAQLTSMTSVTNLDAGAVVSYGLNYWSAEHR